MTDTPSSILLTREQSTGSNVNLWGGYLITTQRQTEQASKGYQTLAVTASATITWSNYATGNTGQCAHLKLTGTLSAAVVLTFPSYMNRMTVDNQTGATVTIMCSSGVGVAIPNARKCDVYCDATDYYTDSPTWTGDVLTAANNGDLMTNLQVATAIATASIPASAGTVLNSVADTTAGYLSQKVTLSLSGLTTTQVSGLTSLTIGTKNSGGNEHLKISSGQGYVGGFLNGGYKNSQFTPVVGNAYDVDCTSAGVTVNLGGMTTPQLGQEIKLNNFGTNQMYLLGTVNSGTNLSINTSSNNTYRYSGSTWGWN